MSRFGLLNLNKPAGWSSRDAVDRVQRLVRPDKIGHAGTLDPLATGVLVVAVGPATRLIDHLHRFSKRYRATFDLGCQSPTDDIESPVERLPASPPPSRVAIETAAAAFIGVIQQVPPAYSAVHVAGRRAYELARRGKSVELSPREVTIHRLEVIDYVYPQLTLEIDCGTGTYVRALGRDLAQQLGTAAVMTALERTAVGPFSLVDALDPDEVDARGVDACLLPARWAVADLPQVVVSPEQLERLRNGVYIDDSRPGPTADAAELAALDETGRLVALLTPRDGVKLGARLNFVV